MRIISSHLKKVMALILIYLTCSQIHATVVMTGTRVVFPSHLHDQKIQFQNKDDIPNIVQIWLDTGNASSTPDIADAPFIANPSIFKIHPKQGQVVRLLFSGNQTDYPQDRESLFFLNFSSIPAYKKSDIDNNKLLFVIKSRVKVFFRPHNLSIAPHETGNHLYYQITRLPKGHRLTLINKSPYHANIANITTNSAQHNLDISALNNATIAPFSTLDHLFDTHPIANNFSLTIGLINDYGVAQVVAIKPLPE